MSVEFSPIGDRLVMLPIDPAQTRGGLHVPKEAAEKLNAMTARVIATGPGLWASDGHRVKMQVNVGDRVTFDAKQCLAMPFDGEMHLVINERDLIAIVRGLD